MTWNSGASITPPNQSRPLVDPTKPNAMSAPRLPRVVFDLMHPPQTPPGDAHPLIWQLSLALREDHTKTDEDGRCATCDEVAPCWYYQLSLRGLMCAVEDR